MHISTKQSWFAALNNHTRSQDALNTAQNQFSSQKISNDLKGYGHKAEIIAAYQANQSEVKAYQDVTKAASARLSAQNDALEMVGTASDNARQDILAAIAAGRADGLVQTIGASLSNALAGLNYKHQGNYLFAGGNDTTAPVEAGNLADLGAASPLSDIFTNGSLKSISKLDGHTRLETGLLASDIGTQVMTAFKAFQDYVAANPLGATLDETQKTALSTLAQNFETSFNALNQQTALNGTLQKRVDTMQTALSHQADNLESVISDHTDTDMAATFSKLQQMQQALQASSQILSGMKDYSLLNYLR